MIYTIKLIATFDTSTSKLVLSSDGVRLVAFPTSRRTANWTDILVNDRPRQPVETAKQLCRVICQAFYQRKQVKQALADKQLLGGI